MTYRFSADAVTLLCAKKDGDNKVQQMIREFESVLGKYGENKMKGANSAIEFIVGKYSIVEASSICPYISKRLGIAEWIVREDIGQRYNKRSRVR